MTLSEKVKAIRQAEGLSQPAFCELTGLSISTLNKYEMGKFEPGGSALIKITQHPRFTKYTLWLMTDQTSEAAGQISPTLSPDGQEGISSPPKDQKVG